MNQQYDTDFYAWTETQADLLEKKAFDQLDIENIMEEIRSLGKSDRRSLESHIIVLLHHKLKLEYHPKNDIYVWHINSWLSSINDSKQAIFFILRDSPSLKYGLREVFKESYGFAIERASKESGLSKSEFPEGCPWKIEEIFPDLEKKYW